MAWVRPTSYSDPNGRWTDETKAYDTDTTTFAYSAIQSPNYWSDYIYFYRASAKCYQVRFICNAYTHDYYPSGDLIDISVEINSNWTSVYSGSFTYNTYVTKGFTANNVTGIRIRFYNGTGVEVNHRIRDLQLNTIDVPSVTTNACSDILGNSVKGNGNITSINGATVTRRGFCYMQGTSGDPTVANSVVYDDGSFGTGTYSKVITGLSSGTSYRVRAYAVNEAGTGYGTTVSVTTANVPTVTTTTPVTTKDHDSATLEGEVTDADGQSITERGFEYQKITAGSTVDATSSAGQKKLYVADTTNFTVGDKIVINRGGDREEDAEIDAITTGDYLTLVDNLTYEHTDVQADAVEICGTTNTVKEESDDFGIGTFDLEVTGLEPYVTYRYRAYAVNQSGTGYGNWESFTTDKTTPTVVTNAVTAIDTTTATANGNITSTGGEDCSERGFEYGLTKVATWTVKDTVGGYGTGAYSKALTSLSPNTIYWIRAYAVNSIGTSYGEWVEFQTAVTGATPTNTRITLTGDVSGYVAQMHASENDLDYPYEGYFVLATDLSETNTLIFYKRLLDLDSYFRKETSGSVTISIKCDHENDWHKIGDVDLTGDNDIVLKHLAPDNLGKHFQVKFSGKNAFRYLGTIFAFVVQGER